jgi:hypothetical protein
MTTIIGFAFPAAIRLSMMKFARPGHQPRQVVVAAAVQQIQHGVALAARGVARRRVDLHAARHAERLRLVVDRRDLSMRHGALGKELGRGARHLEQAAHGGHVDARRLFRGSATATPSTSNQ